MTRSRFRQRLAADAATPEVAAEMDAAVELLAESLT